MLILRVFSTFLRQAHFNIPQNSTMFKLTIILLAFAQVLVSQALLVPRACSTPDLSPPTCETSDGSPLVSDCQAAIAKISTTCANGNDLGSHCSTIVKVGTCKIDACGPTSELEEGVNCGGYLQSVLNSCQSNGKVGGFITPAACNQKSNADPKGAKNSVGSRASPSLLFYRLQFSHS